MFISVAQKRNQVLKVAGKIKMSVGVIAYYNLMQVCQVSFHAVYTVTVGKIVIIRDGKLLLEMARQIG